MMNVKNAHACGIDYFAVYQRPSDGEFVFEKVLKTPSKAAEALGNLETQKRIIYPVSYSTLDHQINFSGDIEERNNEQLGFLSRVFVSPLMLLVETIKLVVRIGTTFFKELPIALYKRDSLCLSLSIYRIGRQFESLLAPLSFPFSPKLTNQIMDKANFYDRLYDLVEQVAKKHTSGQSHLVEVSSKSVSKLGSYPTVDVKLLGYTLRNLREITAPEGSDKQASIDAQMNVISSLGFQTLITKNLWGQKFLEKLETLDENDEVLDTPLTRLSNPFTQKSLRAKLITPEEFGRLTLRECADKFNVYTPSIAKGFKGQIILPGSPVAKLPVDTRDLVMNNFSTLPLRQLSNDLSLIPAICMRYCTDEQIRQLDYNKLSRDQIVNIFKFSSQNENARRLALLTDEQRSIVNRVSVPVIQERNNSSWESPMARY